MSIAVTNLIFSDTNAHTSDPPSRRLLPAARTRILEELNEIKVTSLQYDEQGCECVARSRSYSLSRVFTVSLVGKHKGISRLLSALDKLKIHTRYIRYETHNFESSGE